MQIDYAKICIYYKNICNLLYILKIIFKTTILENQDLLIMREQESKNIEIKITNFSLE